MRWPRTLTPVLPEGRAGPLTLSPETTAPCGPGAPSRLSLSPARGHRAAASPSVLETLRHGRGQRLGFPGPRNLQPCGTRVLDSARSPGTCLYTHDSVTRKAHKRTPWTRSCEHTGHADVQTRTDTDKHGYTGADARPHTATQAVADRAADTHSPGRTLTRTHRRPLYVLQPLPQPLPPPTQSPLQPQTLS